MKDDEEQGSPVKGPLLWAAIIGAAGAAVDPVQGVIEAVVTLVVALNLVRLWRRQPSRT